MPKIPTFQAEGSIEQLAGTTSNIKINPNSTIFNALKPVTNAVVNFKIKENDAQNKTEALKLENDFITDMQKVYDEVNVLENKEIANQILKTKSNSLIEKYKASATNGSVQGLFNNYALAEVQKGIFRTNTQISKNILTSLDNNVSLKENRLLRTAFFAEGNFDYATLENDLTNLYTTNYKGKIPNANLKKIIDSIPGRIEGFEVSKMIVDNPKLAWLKLSDDKQFPNLTAEAKRDLIQDAKGILLPMVQNDWQNFLAASALGKEIDFDMEFAKEIIEPKVFNKMLQQYDSLKNSIANVAIIHSINNADISETLEGFIETIDSEVETGVKTFIEGEKEKAIYLQAITARNTAMDSNPILFITQTNDDVKKLVEELNDIDAVKNNELYLQKKLALVNKLVETQTDMGQPPYKIKVMSISEADGFVERYNNGDAETRVAMLANLEAEFGEYNSQAMLQLSNAGLPITAELSSFFGNAAITNRFINYDEKDEQKKLEEFAIEKGIDFTAVQTNIASGIQEFEDIIAKNNNINTSKAIAKLHNIKKILAYDVLNSMWVDRNLDQVDAEEKAASLIKDHFVIEDTYYVPTIYNGDSIKHTIESDTGIIAKADLIQKKYLDEFNAVAFESDDKDVTEVQLTEAMKEQMEDNGEWRNTADGNGLIFGIVFPDASFAPVKNADGEFLTFNFDDTSLTLPGTDIELEYSKKITKEKEKEIAITKEDEIKQIIEETKEVEKITTIDEDKIKEIIKEKKIKEKKKETKISFSDKKKSEQHKQLLEWWKTKYQTKDDFIDTSLAKIRLKKDWKVPVEKHIPSDYEIRKLKDIGATDKDFKRLDKQNATKAIEITSSNLAGDGGYSKKDYKILLGQIAQIESQFNSIVQIPKKDNPEEKNFYASSYWQIEVPTARDLLENMLPGKVKKPIFGPNFESTFAEYKSDKYRTVVESLYNLSKKELVVLLRTDFTLAAHFAGALIATRFK